MPALRCSLLGDIAVHQNSQPQLCKAFISGYHRPCIANLNVYRCRKAKVCQPAASFRLHFWQNACKLLAAEPCRFARLGSVAMSGSRVERGRVQVRAAAETVSQEAKTELTFPRVKEFLEDLTKVGRVRLIVNTGMGVLESVTTLEGLFYREFGGKGEYGNVIKQEDNVDFHLLLNKIVSVKLQKGTSPFNGATTYMVRLLDAQGTAGASVLVMWKPGTQGEYDEGQVEAFDSLMAKYGEEHTFACGSSEEDATA